MPKHPTAGTINAYTSQRVERRDFQVPIRLEARSPESFLSWREIDVNSPEEGCCRVSQSGSDPICTENAATAREATVSFERAA